MVDTYFYNNVARSKQKLTSDGAIKLAAKRATTLYRCYGSTPDDIYRENAPYYVRHGNKDFEISVKVKAKMQHLSDQSGLFIREKRDKYCAVYLEISHPTGDMGLDKSRNNYYISVAFQNGKDKREYKRLTDLDDLNTYYFKMKRLGDVVECYASKDGDEFECIETYYFSKEEKLNVGVFAASPGNSTGLKSTFYDLEYTDLPSTYHYGAESEEEEEEEEESDDSSDDDSKSVEKEKSKSIVEPDPEPVAAEPEPVVAAAAAAAVEETIAAVVEKDDDSDDGSKSSKGSASSQKSAGSKSSKGSDGVEGDLEKEIAALEANLGDDDDDDASKKSSDDVVKDDISSTGSDKKEEETAAAAPPVVVDVPVDVVEKKNDDDDDASKSSKGSDSGSGSDSASKASAAGSDVKKEDVVENLDDMDLEAEIKKLELEAGGGSDGSGGSVGSGSDSSAGSDLSAQIRALELGADSDSD